MSVALLVTALFLPAPWNVVLALVAIEPIIYGTHEALHTENNSQEDDSIAAPRLVASVGMSLQLLNIEILKFAHLYHHRLGRYGDGWAPDITPSTPTAKQRVRYYASLVLLPALCWQIASLLRPFLPLRRQPYLREIGYTARVNLRYVVCACMSIAFVGSFIALSGWRAFVVYWLLFCLLWSVQQNIAHYGLKGVDPVTDRLCAHTYYLQWPFSWITYGSTAHFLHHADQTVPAYRLYEHAELQRVEEKYSIAVIPKFGVGHYLADILRQFKGPVPVDKLTLDWVSQLRRPSKEEEIAKFEYRRGRVWASRPR
ncbi:fatty acid desaturase [Kribbella sp. CA-294648]|uniref:fatty acid desaturase n=1 Tax=Kribbella sp. CA-294648 TaxID=3239948 RepID=UPI003D8F86DA